MSERLKCIVDMAARNQTIDVMYGTQDSPDHLDDLTHDAIATAIGDMQSLTLPRSSVQAAIRENLPG